MTRVEILLRDLTERYGGLSEVARAYAHRHGILERSAHRHLWRVLEGYAAGPETVARLQTLAEGWANDHDLERIRAASAIHAELVGVSA